MEFDDNAEERGNKGHVVLICIGRNEAKHYFKKIKLCCDFIFSITSPWKVHNKASSYGPAFSSRYLQK